MNWCLKSLHEFSVILLCLSYQMVRLHICIQIFPMEALSRNKRSGFLNLFLVSPPHSVLSVSGCISSLLFLFDPHGAQGKSTLPHTSLPRYPHLNTLDCTPMAQFLNFPLILSPLSLYSLFSPLICLVFLGLFVCLFLTKTPPPTLYLSAFS